MSEEAVDELKDGGREVPATKKEMDQQLIAFYATLLKLTQGESLGIPSAFFTYRNTGKMAGIGTMSLKASSFAGQRLVTPTASSVARNLAPRNIQIQCRTLEAGKKSSSLYEHVLSWSGVFSTPYAA